MLAGDDNFPDAASFYSQVFFVNQQDTRIADGLADDHLIEVVFRRESPDGVDCRFSLPIQVGEPRLRKMPAKHQNVMFAHRLAPKHDPADCGEGLRDLERFGKVAIERRHRMPYRNLFFEQPSPQPLKTSLPPQIERMERSAIQERAVNIRDRSVMTERRK